SGGGRVLYGMGHHGDIAPWGLTSSKYGAGRPEHQIGPGEVTATAEFPAGAAVWNTATKYRVTCKYPNNIEFIIAGGHGDIHGGTKWIGEHGWVHVDRGAFETSDPHWKGEIKKREEKKELAVLLPGSPSHQRAVRDAGKSCAR